jgi:biotin carboxylase
MDVSGKKLMILGAGHHQVPLIRTAINLGLETHVCSIAGDYPGIAIAPNFHEVDISKPQAVLQIARTISPDGILTTATDVCLESIGLVVDELNLPGSGYETSSSCLSKVLMKRKLLQSGVPTAHYRVVNDVNSAIDFFNNQNGPCVIKPADSSGSRGVHKIADVEDVQHAFQSALNFSKSGTVLVEEWLEGEEFGAQAVVEGEQCKLLILHSDVTTAPPRRIPLGHGCPHPNEAELIEVVRKIVDDAIASLDIKNTISNVDFILTENGPKIIELTCRMGGTRLPEVCGTYWGVDFYALAIHLALGQRTQLSPTPLGKPNAAHNLILNREGTVMSMGQISEEYNHEIYFRKGDCIRLNSAQQAELGYIQLTRDGSLSVIQELVNEANRFTDSVQLLED